LIGNGEHNPGAVEDSNPNSLRLPKASAPKPAVLVTGSRGVVGRWLTAGLRTVGHKVITFDLRDGDDIRDAPAVHRAAARADAVIHCAALQFGQSTSLDAMLDVNARGAENVLRAAESAGHSTAIVFSSIRVFGLLDGERLPMSLPIRDSFPTLATEPYARSKIAAEDLCEAFALRTGTPTFSFRPAHVWVPGQAADLRRHWSRHPGRELAPPWDFGAFIDVRDVVRAVLLALACKAPGHHRLTLCAADIAASLPTLEALRKALPDVPIEPGWPGDRYPYASLFATSSARTLLGWEPRYSWAAGSRESMFARARRRLRRPSPP
jgi:nucleoside-diphosphate-sugar epimerase